MDEVKWHVFLAHPVYIVGFQVIDSDVVCQKSRWGRKLQFSDGSPNFRQRRLWVLKFLTLPLKFSPCHEIFPTFVPISAFSDDNFPTRRFSMTVFRLLKIQGGQLSPRALSTPLLLRPPLVIETERFECPLPLLNSDQWPIPQM